MANGTENGSEHRIAGQIRSWYAVCALRSLLGGKTMSAASRLVSKLFLIAFAILNGATISSSSGGMIVYRQGQDNGFGVYTGASDTSIGEPPIADNNYSTDDRLYIDGSPGINQAMIRFDGIFGVGAGQVPLGSTINSATFTLYAWDTGTLRNPERMLADWDASTITYNNAMLGGNTQVGIQRDGIEATADATEFTEATTGENLLDVTSIVQVWSDGAPNYGFALLEWDSNGLQSASSDATTVSQRPGLTIDFTPIPEPSTCILTLFGIMFARARCFSRAK
jgi:hypothetical protein